MPLEPSALTNAMEEAFKKEWLAAKNSPIPEAGAEVRLLLATIARGLLEYIEAHQDEVLNSITLEEGSETFVRKVTGIDINISAD